MSIPTITLCQVAFGLATLSLVLQMAAAIARSKASAPAPAPSTPLVRTTFGPKKPSLKLTRMELLKHARDLKIGTAKWRAHARKVQLLEAIRAQNIQRRTA